jgi:hypothetical protein
MSTHQPSERPVLDYRAPAPEAGRGDRPGLRVASVLVGTIGFLAFGAGCAIVVLVVTLQPIRRGAPFTAAGLYFAIAGVCAFAAIRWGRTAFAKRRRARDRSGG